MGLTQVDGPAAAAAAAGHCALCWQGLCDRMAAIASTGLDSLLPATLWPPSAGRWLRGCTSV